ncbi:MAG TPA: adenosylcobinamide-GDP ribazoletransferase, partial [Thermoanaerobaculia bacterium]|nr:adenosylcobinamide-GDP ribazoletransferase [Thermoanaerobaculia bacterium]
MATHEQPPSRRAEHVVVGGEEASAEPGVSLWRREAAAIATAFAFLTRLPLPRRLPAAAAVERAVGWFPLVGGVVGGAA